MKKHFVVFLAICLLLALAACGRRDDPAPPQQGQEDQSQIPEGGGNSAPEVPEDSAEPGDDAPLLPDPENAGDGLEDLGESGAASLAASHSDVTLQYAGDNFRLSVLGVEGICACSFASSDPAVASVDETTGEVTAVSPGTATVSMHVEWEGGQYDFPCTVRCVWEEGEAELPGADILASLPERFDFSSGVGAWSTELKIAADGTFNGLYHDANAGESGEGYTSTIYTCQFYGEFSAPVKVNDYTYSMTLESLHLVDEAGQESIDGDGTRWVTSTPHGLEGADEVLIYLPGAPVAELPEEFINWTQGTFWNWDDPERAALPRYGLYNVKEGLGFAGVG